MKSNRLSTRRLCSIGIIIAVYFLLAKLTIPIGNLHITLASLPVVVLAVLNGPLDATIAALLGEFMIQALGRYGLTPTTPLWCLPPVLRVLTVGFGCRFAAKKFSEGSTPYIVSFYSFIILGALLTTIGNTAVTWIDSVIYGYYSYVYVFGQLVIRLVTGVVTALLVATVTLPIVKAMRKVLHNRR